MRNQKTLMRMTTDAKSDVVDPWPTRSQRPCSKRISSELKLVGLAVDGTWPESRTLCLLHPPSYCPYFFFHHVLSFYLFRPCSSVGVRSD